MYLNGQITGDYPSDKTERANWMAAGIQPNSLVLTASDGTKRYISLNNLGVFSMLLKYPAKIAEYYKEADEKIISRSNSLEVDRRIQNDVVAASLAVGESLLEETVLRNISDFFIRMSRGFSNADDIENFTINFLTNPAKNMVPRILRQIISNKDYKEITENNYQSLKDVISGSPIKYDVFGDPMQAPDFWKSMAGVKTQEIPKEERYKYIMAALDITVPGVTKTEMPLKGHSVGLTETQINEVYKRMGELGIGEIISNIVSGIDPKNISVAERDVIQTSINRKYDIIKKAALNSLINEGGEINKGFYQRLDKDNQEKYNKINQVVPSLAL